MTRRSRAPAATASARGNASRGGRRWVVDGEGGRGRGPAVAEGENRGAMGLAGDDGSGVVTAGVGRRGSTWTRPGRHGGGRARRPGRGRSRQGAEAGGWLQEWGEVDGGDCDAGMVKGEWARSRRSMRARDGAGDSVGKGGTGAR